MNEETSQHYWQKVSKQVDFMFPKAISLVDIVELHLYPSTQIINIYIKEVGKKILFIKF